MSSGRTSDAELAVGPLHVEGLCGRVLTAVHSSQHDADILLVYGQHANLERMTGLAAALARHGRVTCPDLAGFGGMQSLAASGSRIDCDAVADVLAATVRSCYGPTRRFSIVAVSFGLVIAVKMLARHPDLVARVHVVVSVSGLTGGQDIAYSSPKRRLMRLAATLASTKAVARLISSLIQRCSTEMALWCCGDWQTRMCTLAELLTPAVPPAERLPLTVHHVAPTDDRHVDHERVASSLRARFAETLVSALSYGNHVPEPDTPAEAYVAFLPGSVRRALDEAPSIGDVGRGVVRHSTLVAGDRSAVSG